MFAVWTLSGSLRGLPPPPKGDFGGGLGSGNVEAGQLLELPSENTEGGADLEMQRVFLESPSRNEQILDMYECIDSPVTFHKADGSDIHPTKWQAIEEGNGNFIHMRPEGTSHINWATSC